ncbi:MAG TPA: hypothetical protein VFN22_01810 [Gemmatimonadales bacterium]|nr:hypothetical protein [Gemmatimonadales bacterium]
MVAITSTRTTPRTTNPARGQLSATGAPTSSGTVNSLAQVTRGSVSAASITRGSIHTMLVTEASNRPVIPLRFQRATGRRTASGSHAAESHPATARRGNCTSIWRSIVDSNS